jgi:hypothetical protein
LGRVACARFAAPEGHSGVAAQLAGGLCACLGAGAVVAWMAPSLQLASGAVGVIMLVLAGVLVSSLFFADLHWASAVLVLVSLAAPWLLAQRSVDRPWRAAIARAALAAIFGGAAIAVAALTTPPFGE